MRALFLIGPVVLALLGCASRGSLPDRPLDGHIPAGVEVTRSAPTPGQADAQFLRISGVWMNLRSGKDVSDFELRNVRVHGDRFSADFFFGSSRRLSCAFESKVEGTFRTGILEFETVIPCGGVSLRPAISTINWRGYYLAGRTGYGWFIVKNVIVNEKL